MNPLDLIMASIIIFLLTLNVVLVTWNLITTRKEKP